MNLRWFTIAAAGVLFGLGLAISGMADPGRVIGFLDVTGAWDPSLMFVMGGAVMTFGLGMWLRRKMAGDAGWFGTTLPTRNTNPIDCRLLLGTSIFGIGWGLAGFCPGPAIASLVLIRTEALLFVPAMAAGMFLARVAAGADRD